MFLNVSKLVSSSFSMHPQLCLWQALYALRACPRLPAATVVSLKPCLAPPLGFSNSRTYRARNELFSQKFLSHHVILICCQKSKWRMRRIFPYCLIDDLKRICFTYLGHHNSICDWCTILLLTIFTSTVTVFNNIILLIILFPPYPWSGNSVIHMF